MSSLPDNCIDLIIADPPYNLSKGEDWKWYRATHYAFIRFKSFSTKKRSRCIKHQLRFGADVHNVSK